MSCADLLEEINRSSWEFQLHKHSDPVKYLAAELRRRGSYRNKEVVYKKMLKEDLQARSLKKKAKAWEEFVIKNLTSKQEELVH